MFAKISASTALSLMCFVCKGMGKNIIALSESVGDVVCIGVDRNYSMYRLFASNVQTIDRAMRFQDTYIIDEPSNRPFFNLLQNITMPDGREMSFAAFWHANGTSRNTTFESFVLEIMSNDWLTLKRMKEKSFTENNLVYFAMFVLVVLVATLVTIILKRQIIPARLSFT